MLAAALEAEACQRTFPFFDAAAATVAIPYACNQHRATSEVLIGL